MNIVYCRSCASELPDTAPSCTACGAQQARVLAAAAALAGAAAPRVPTPRSIGKLLLLALLVGLSVVFCILLYTMYEWNRAGLPM
jgi:uncharacterized membrane protein